MTTTFDALGVSPDLVEALAEPGHHRPLPDPGADHPRRPRRPRRVRQGQDRLGQDPRLRPARSSSGSAKAEPRRPAASCSCPPASSPLQVHDVLAPLGRAPSTSRVVAIYGGANMDKQIKALDRRRRHRRRHAGPPDRPDRAQGGVARRPRASSCSTRPTAWPTWGSCPRSSGSCATSTAGTRRCCSRPRSTASSTRLIKRYQHDPVHARGRVRRSVTVDEMHAPLPARPRDGQGEGRRRHRRGSATARIDLRAHQAGRRPAGRAARARRACDAAAIHGDLRQSAAGEGAGRLLGRQAAGAGRHRRRRPGHPRRRRRRRDPLRPARGPQGLPAPLGPHRPRRRVRPGRHARAVEPGARGQAAA